MLSLSLSPISTVDAAVAPLLQVSGVSKSFPGVRALRSVDFDVRPGEVHCLIGENGAGKSTLVKILAGAQPPDSGEIAIEGAPMQFRGPTDAKAAGIACIFQELSVVAGLTVAENIVLGAEPGRFGRFDRREAEKIAGALLAGIGFPEMDVAARVGSLSPSQKQAVMIAKALHSEAKIIIMDEPTSPLEDREVQKLFAVIARLKAEGKGIIYVSHKMREIDEIADRVTVLKDGQRVATLKRGEASGRDLVRLTVGRDLADMFPAKQRRHGDVLLVAEGLSGPVLRDVSLDVRAGEILGVAGLVGAGRTELLRAIFGADAVAAGVVRVGAVPIPTGRVRSAIKAGMALVPEERRAQGIIGALSVLDNILLPWAEFPDRRGAEIDAEAAGTDMIRRMDVRTPSPDRRIGLLSGGNQQKVVLGKWLLMQTKVLLLDEPTRGIDVGAKREFYRTIHDLAAEGMAILLVSSELTEILGLAHRIVVLHEGSIVGELDGDASEEDVIALSMLHAS